MALNENVRNQAKRYRQTELFDTHAPLQSLSAWYAPFLAANFSLCSLICALSTLYFLPRTLLFDHNKHTILCIVCTWVLLALSPTNHLYTGNWDSMTCSNLLSISYSLKTFLFQSEIKLCNSQKRYEVNIVLSTQLSLCSPLRRLQQFCLL